ncbi:MAG: phosphonate metabolism protein PhnP [Hyphomicrobium sp.]|nr:phosphonate metabolism protein PhnP [Hyphomicrobium sp.]
MRLTFLGTGGVWAAPVHGCACVACTRACADDSLRRRPASALVECDGFRLLIDGGREDLPELFPPGTLDAMLLTHFHPDHVLGLFRLRWSKAERLTVFCPPDAVGCDDLRRHPGRLAFRDVEPFIAFEVGPLTVTAVPLIHSRLTFGWLVEHRGKHIAYLSDTIGLPEATISFLAPLAVDTLVLDCAYPPNGGPGRNHNDIDEAIATIKLLAPRRAFLTHVNHELDCWLIDRSLPGGIVVGRDAQRVILVDTSVEPPTPRTSD